MPGQHPLPGFPDGRGFSGGHQAVDIPAPAGTPVRSMGAGIVYAAGDDGASPYNLDLSESGGGKLVAIRHRYDPPSPRAPRPDVVTQYAHLSSIAVAAGQKVAAGQTIGAVGSTGNSTGNHLHLGVRVGGVWRNYRELLAMPGSLSGSVPAPSTGGLPAGYGSGPVQPAPNGLDGKGVSAYPLDAGKTCAAGYRPGMVDPRLHGAIPGSIWWNRPQTGGQILACVADGLQVGDNAAATDAGRYTGDALAALGDTLGDTARNLGLFLLFAVILILGLWALTRGRS